LWYLVLLTKHHKFFFHPNIINCVRGRARVKAPGFSTKRHNSLMSKQLNTFYGIPWLVLTDFEIYRVVCSMHVSK
jgi:hypothetical protein